MKSSEEPWNTERGFNRVEGRKEEFEVGWGAPVSSPPLPTSASTALTFWNHLTYLFDFCLSLPSSTLAGSRWFPTTSASSVKVRVRHKAVGSCVVKTFPKCLVSTPKSDPRSLERGDLGCGRWSCSAPYLPRDLRPMASSMAHRLQLRLLTWDVKDTLLQLRYPVGEEYATKARAHGLQVEATALGQAFRQAYRAQSHSFPNYGLSHGLTSHQWWLDVVLKTFHLAGVPDVQAVASIAEQLYKDFSSPCSWQVLEGAETTLRGCRKRGLRLAVVSNFDRRLENILVGLGLREHFDFVLTSEAAGCPKPDPRIFQESLRLANMEPTVTAHIGDNYHCDYQGARAAGMHSFLVLGPEPLDPVIRDSVPEEHILPSLSHLLPALDRLEGSSPGL
ncbi:haloacid dehalogenase-like hydrolase domain-containing protein 3 isoform X2 [Castor canadensis]|uniref:Haloacid dehalogenase-like hydrolase domain-containing protein 3 isoform X2 n=1 Tax=Castor canadensis TaxID=51338 RepID=A0AC58KRD1_CASCN